MPLFLPLMLLEVCMPEPHQSPLFVSTELDKEVHKTLGWRSHICLQGQQITSHSTSRSEKVQVRKPWSQSPVSFFKRMRITLQSTGAQEHSCTTDSSEHRLGLGRGPIGLGLHCDPEDIFPWW